MDEGRKEGAQLCLVVPNADGPPQVLQLRNPVLMPLTEISGMLSQVSNPEENKLVLKIFRNKDSVESIEFELETQGQNIRSTANIDLEVDTSKGIVILTSSDKANKSVQWKSTVIYTLVCEESTALALGNNPSHYKGYCSNTSLDPFTIDFEKHFAASEEIGEGTYGTVFKCSIDDLQFAVKKMRKPSTGAQSTEVAAMAKLYGADHVVQMYSSWSEKQVSGLSFVYIAMKLFERNLDDYFETRAELDLPMNKQIFTEILLGVKAIHQSGIIHRDLKPMNVLLDSNGHASIADFGMAKIIPNFDPISTESFPGHPMYGTQYYSDPDLMSGEYDKKVDIYSCGMIYLEMYFLSQRRKFIRDFSSKYKHQLKDKRYDIWNSSMWKDWRGDKEIMKLMMLTRLNRPDSSYFLEKLQGATEAKEVLE